MIVIGGRTDTVGETVALEVYDTETSEWTRFPTIQRFRHACWCVDTFLYMHGGFDNESPTIPTDAIMKLDALEVLKPNQTLVDKIKSYCGGSPTQSTPGPRAENTDNASPSTDSASPTGVLIEQPHFEPDPYSDGPSKYAPSGTTNDMDHLCNIFLNHLLRPREWASSTTIGMSNELGDLDRFYFRTDHIIAIVDEAINVMKGQEMVLKVEAPVKVFGDIHG